MVISKWLHLILVHLCRQIDYLAISTGAEYDILCLKNVPVIKFLSSKIKETYSAKIKFYILLVFN